MSGLLRTSRSRLLFATTVVNLTWITTLAATAGWKTVLVGLIVSVTLGFAFAGVLAWVQSGESP